MCNAWRMPMTKYIFLFEWILRPVAVAVQRVERTFIALPICEFDYSVCVWGPNNIHGMAASAHTHTLDFAHNNATIILTYGISDCRERCVACWRMERRQSASKRRKVSSAWLGFLSTKSQQWKEKQQLKLAHTHPAHIFRSFWSGKRFFLFPRLFH